ncbi:MAG: hypothetical protein LLF92_07315 [Planctomycetaceae bacterium]|nr:hypothetical protein [Planctomycetaceae bacterium]
MIEKIDNSQVPDVMKDILKQSGPSAPKANNLEDASLQITHQEIIEQAGQLPSQDTNAVEEARKLIMSGQLDTPENIRAAAQNIAKFGV